MENDFKSKMDEAKALVCSKRSENKFANRLSSSLEILLSVICVIGSVLIF